MKLHLLLLSIFTFAIIGSASAQVVDKGSHYIGGSLYYNYDGGPGTTTTYNFANGTTQYTISNLTTFQINPEFGYFLSKNWTIGIQPNYSHSSGTETSLFTLAADQSQSTYISTYHINVVGLTVNFRYYCMLSDRIGIFPQFGISTQNDVKDFGNGEITVLGSPNIVFFATPKLGINMGFGNLKYATDYHFNYSYFNLSFNNAITFGVNYYYGGKK